MSRPARETVASGSGPRKCVQLYAQLPVPSAGGQHREALLIALLLGHGVDVGCTAQARALGWGLSTTARARASLEAQGLVHRAHDGQLVVDRAALRRWAAPYSRPLPWVLLDAGLHAQELVAAAHVLKQLEKAGKWITSQRAVARDVGCRVRGVKAAVDELVRLGLVVIDGKARKSGWQKSIPLLRLHCRLVRGCANKPSTLQRWSKRSARSRTLPKGTHLHRPLERTSQKVREPKRGKGRLAPQRRRRWQRLGLALVQGVVVQQRRRARQQQPEAETKLRKQLLEQVQTGRLQRIAWRGGSVQDALAVLASSAGCFVLPGAPRRSGEQARELQTLCGGLAHRHGVAAFDQALRDLVDLCSSTTVRSVGAAMVWRLRQQLQRAPNTQAPVRRAEAPASRQQRVALDYLAGAVQAGNRKHVVAAWRRCQQAGLTMELAADRALVPLDWLRAAVEISA